MKFLGDTKAETTADTKVIWLILPRGCRRPLSTASSSPASPCSHSTHSITLGFPSPGQCQQHLIFSLFSVSLSPAEAQGTDQEVQMCPFLQGSFSLPLWIFIPGAMLEQGRWQRDGKVLTSLTYMVLL